MNEIQKEKVISMRIQGFGYKTIAKEMDISLDSVKSFCERNNLGGSNNAVVTKNYETFINKEITCKHCNKRIRKKIKGRSKKFCSDYCRRKWWNVNQDKRKKGKDSMYKFTCPTCGNEFSSYGNKKRVYCSNRCYVKARFYEEEITNEYSKNENC